MKGGRKSRWDCGEEPESTRASCSAAEAGECALRVPYTERSRRRRLTVAVIVWSRLSLPRESSSAAAFGFERVAATA